MIYDDYTIIRMASDDCGIDSDVVATVLSSLNKTYKSILEQGNSFILGDVCTITPSWRKVNQSVTPNKGYTSLVRAHINEDFKSELDQLLTNNPIYAEKLKFSLKEGVAVR